MSNGSIVVVGAGLSGLATALSAAVRGLEVTVLEASDKVGGAAAYSGGQVWVAASHVAAREGIDGDSLELGERYIRAIAHDHPEFLDEQAMRRWLTAAPQATRYWEELGAIRWDVIPGLADYHDEADGARANGRYLTAVFHAAALGEWRERLLVTPYFPVGTTYPELFGRGRRSTTVATDHNQGQGFGQVEHEENVATAEPELLTFGTGVVAGFLARAAREPGISIRTGCRVTELITDTDGRVVGARADSDDGPIEVAGPVVLATSSYDWDPELVQEIVGLGPDDFGSVAPKTVRGDGIRLTRSVGGDVVRMPSTAVTMQPGWASDFGEGFSYGPDTAMPHTMIVDRHGRRYCDDSYWVDIAHRTVDPDDPHLPFFLIFDEQHHNKYGLGITPPAGRYPDGLVTSAPTLAQLGEALAIDGAQLERTVARFNEFARTGVDEDYGRGTRGYVRRFYGDPEHTPNPVLGTVAAPPFHGVRLRFIGAAVGNSGIRIDADAHVLDTDGKPIAGLHAVGSCGALSVSGTGYNSGIALGRALTHAYLAAAELAGEPIPDL